MGLFDRRKDALSDRELARFDTMTPDEKISSSVTRSSNALLAELRFIRWLLLILLVIAIRAMFEFAGSDWWYTSGF